jgi:DNA-binding beta-propeller fold protein YncE
MLSVEKCLIVSLFFLGKIVSAQANVSDLKKYATKDFLLSTAPTGCMPKGIKIDPVGNSLYVAEMCGKIDIIDTQLDRVVFTLVGGAQPTGLEVTRDNQMLISSSLIDDKVHFFNLKKLLDLYELGEK